MKHPQIKTFLILLFFSPGLFSQTRSLGMKEALSLGLANYGTIKAKTNYLNATKATAQQVQLDYLPNLVLSAQQDYGTINGQNGPLYGFGGLGVASSGLPLASQNWNAAFGALYLANINWEFFSFGRNLARINIVKAQVNREEKDLEQEQFQHQVKVAAAYLNLLAAQLITRSQEKNLERALVFKLQATARSKNGLSPGVDSSLAGAEVSAAKINLIKAKDVEQEQASKLALLLGISPVDFQLDSSFVSQLPAGIAAGPTGGNDVHPVLLYYKSRVSVSDEQLKLFRRQYFPSLSLFGVIQERGSGFQSAYTQDQTAYTQDYASGVTPTRTNYLFGLGLNWNLTAIVRNTRQVKSQQFISEGLQNEYELADQTIHAQILLSETKIKNALLNYNEAPLQVKAATDAYNQKNVLYKNGLATLVDVTQTLYSLNRAETDRDIAYSNVWQALLLKAAANGDFNLFIKEF